MPLLCMSSIRSETLESYHQYPPCAAPKRWIVTEREDIPAWRKVSSWLRLRTPANTRRPSSPSAAPWTSSPPAAPTPSPPVVRLKQNLYIAVPSQKSPATTASTNLPFLPGTHEAVLNRQRWMRLTHWFAELSTHDSGLPSGDSSCGWIKHGDPHLSVAPKVSSACAVIFSACFPAGQDYIHSIYQPPDTSTPRIQCLAPSQVTLYLRTKSIDRGLHLPGRGNNCAQLLCYLGKPQRNT